MIISLLLGRPVLAGFGKCGCIVFHCELVNFLNIKTESMLLFIDPNDHQYNKDHYSHYDN